MSVQNIKGSVSKLPVVDSTLTRSGYSADAKATGDAIAANKQKLTEEVARLDAELAVERGKIDQIANDQIPQEYLEAAVDNYVKENEAGLATKDSLEAVESELKSDLGKLNSDSTNATNSTNIEINNIVSRFYEFQKLTEFETVSGWKINPQTGLSEQDSMYSLKKYRISNEDVDLRITSSDCWQFQYSLTVPTEGQSNRIDETYLLSKDMVTIPPNAEYLIMSVPNNTENLVEIYLDEKTDNVIFGNYLDMEKITEKSWIKTNGDLAKGENGYFTSDFIKIPLSYPDILTRFVVAYDLSTSGAWGANARQICFYDENKEFISLWGITDVDRSVVEIPSGACYIRVCFYDTESKWYVTFQNNKNVPSYSEYDPKIHGNKLPHSANNIRNTDGAVSALLKTAMDYYRNNEFGYGNNHTAFDDECGGKFTGSYYSGERYQVDCSSFVELCLRGIKFENSRYLPENTDNVDSIYGYQWNEAVNYESFLDTGRYNGTYNRIYANELARYAYVNGFLYNINKDFSNVKAGDLIFWSETEQWANLKFWRKIGHVAIVAEVIQTSANTYAIRTLESSGGTPTVKSRVLYPSDNTVLLYGARYPLYDVLPTSKNICETFEPVGGSYTITTGHYHKLCSLNLSEDLKSKAVYTLVMKLSVDIPTDSKIEYWISNKSTNDYIIKTIEADTYIRPDGLLVQHFEIPMDLVMDAPRVFDIFVKGETNSTGNVSIENLKLYTGYVTADDSVFN